MDRETVGRSESGRWLGPETPTTEWQRCTHWAIDRVLETGELAHVAGGMPNPRQAAAAATQDLPSR